MTKLECNTPAPGGDRGGNTNQAQQTESKAKQCQELCIETNHESTRILIQKRSVFQSFVFIREDSRLFFEAIRLSRSTYCQAWHDLPETRRACECQSHTSSA